MSLFGLRDQLLAQGGNWNIGGIDRAQELADLMGRAGLTDISGGITYNPGSVWTQADEDRAATEWGSGGGEAGNFASGPWSGSGNTIGQVVQGHNPNVSIGGKNYGYINNGDSGLHGTANSKLGNTQFAYSSKGDGGVRYVVQQGEDGKARIVPQWTSSSDMGDVRTIAKLGAAVFGGGHLLNSALGGAAGAGAGSAGSAAGFLGEGVASGIPAWDAAAGLQAAGGAGSAAGFLGEGATSGIPAWDSAGSGLLGSPTKAALYGAEGYGPGMTGAQTSAYDGVLGATGSKTLADVASGGSGLLGKFGSLLKTPGMLQLLGAGLAGAGANKATSKPPMQHLPVGTSYTPAPTMPQPTDNTPITGSGPGLFAEYMKRNQQKKAPTFYAPVFGG